MHDMFIIGFFVVSVLVWFFIGFLPMLLEYLKLKEKPLTYYECLNLPAGTEVSLLQYGFKDKGWKHRETGVVYARKDGTKAINVGDGDIEFTQADVWVDGN